MPKLSAVEQKFILHWGEMGTRWGVNRTVAQVHALLYLSPLALPAEEIAKTLSVARSNVSNSLRELQGWGIVRVVHVLGDRRDHFESLKDVWEMFSIILQERKRREIDPTLRVLRECLAELGPPNSPHKSTDEQKNLHERLMAMQEFLTAATALYEECRRVSPQSMRRLVSLGGQLRKWIGKQGTGGTR